MTYNICGIYQIRNKINDKIYVGSSVNIRKRKNNHLSDLRNNTHSTLHLQNAFNKYGESAFEFHVIEEVDKDHLAVREEYWIKTLGSQNREYGYNTVENITNNIGWHHSEETKEKISRNRKGKGKHKYNICSETRKFKQEMAKNLQQYRTKEVEEKRLNSVRMALKGKSLWNEEQKREIGERNSGSKNGQAKLSEGDVAQIKKLLQEGKLSQQKISQIFNISRENVSKIKRGLSWKHVIAS